MIKQLRQHSPCGVSRLWGHEETNRIYKISVLKRSVFRIPDDRELRDPTEAPESSRQPKHEN